MAWASFSVALPRSATAAFPAPFQVLETLVHAGSGICECALAGEPIRQYDWWAVSRIIPTTINEFPYLELPVC